MDAPQQSRPRASRPEQQHKPAGSEHGPKMRHVHRERDYGIGYGNSSGYATLRHFTHGHADPLFRLG